MTDIPATASNHNTLAIWQKSQEAVRRGDWAAYGQEQKRLEEALRQAREGR